MTHNDQQVTTAEGKADAFNKYFASIFRPVSPSSPIVSPILSSQNNLESITVSTEEVNYLLLNLLTDKATAGPDGISARLLKE